MLTNEKERLIHKKYNDEHKEESKAYREANNKGAAQFSYRLKSIFETSEGFDWGSGAEPQGQISHSSVSLTGGAPGTGARWERGGRTGKKREGPSADRQVEGSELIDVSVQPCCVMLA